MKLRHYLLLLGVALVIGFLEKLVFLIGGLALIVGAGLLIYGDLTPEAQAGLERRLAWMLGGLRANAGRGLPPGSQSLTVSSPLRPGVPRRRRNDDSPN